MLFAGKGSNMHIAGTLDWCIILCANHNTCVPYGCLGYLVNT